MKYMQVQHSALVRHVYDCHIVETAVAKDRGAINNAQFLAVTGISLVNGLVAEGDRR